MQEKKKIPWGAIIGIFAVVVVVAAGIIILSRPSLTYKMNMQASLDDLYQKDAWYYPWQLDDMMGTKNPEIVLFDIRNDYDFAHGHIPGAENVQAIDLNREKFRKRMEELAKHNTTVVLYGKDQLQATGPWMLFREAGFKNVKILLGGYDYYLQHKNNLAATKNDSTLQEGIPRYDFAKMASSKSEAGVQQKTEKKPVVIRRRKKATMTEGGC